MALSDRPYGPTSGATSVLAQFPMNTQGSVPGPIPAQVSLPSAAETLLYNSSNPSLPLLVNLAPDTKLEQTVWDLWASGVVTATAAGNVTFKVYEGAAIAAGNLLGSSGAIAQAVGTQAWYAHASLIYDSVSGVLAGAIEFYVARTMVAKTTISNFVGGFRNVGNPGANPPTSSNVPTFCLSATSSGATAALPTTVNVQKFSCG